MMAGRRPIGLRAGVLAAVAGLCVGLGRLAAADAPAELTFAVLPRYSSLETLGQYAALIGEIKMATGKKVVLKQGKDNDDHLRMLKAGEVDFSFENPVVFAMAGDKVELLASAVMDGAATMYGIVITREESPIKKLEDLKGKKVATIGKTSAGGFYSQQLACLTAGFSLEQDCTLSESPDSKADFVIKAVFDKTAEAGCIREDDWKRVGNLVGDAKALRIVDKGAELPGWAFAAKRTLPAEIKQQVRERLLKLESGHRALVPAKVDRFVEGKDDQYQPLRHLLSPQ